MRVLLAADVQNDFITGSLTITRAEEIVPVINELAQRYRARGDVVVFSLDWHPATTPHFDTWPVHCVQGTGGAQLHPALEVEPTDLLAKKGLGRTDGYSVFEASMEDGNTFAAWLDGLGVDELHVCGLATDYCVVNTVLDACRAGIPTTVLLDACRAVNLQPTDEQDAIERMRAAGAIVAARGDEERGRASA